MIPAIVPNRCLERCATPVRWAALATALATFLATIRLNMLGMMYSASRSSGETVSAMAFAADNFISSFTELARTSNMPRKKPGKQSELFI